MIEDDGGGDDQKPAAVVTNATDAAATAADDEDEDEDDYGVSTGLQKGTAAVAATHFVNNVSSISSSSSSADSSGLGSCSTDLIREIATFLVDDADTLLKLACVSKPCHVAVLESPQLWKAACRYRWKSKWGFYPRWKQAIVMEANAANATTIEADGRWWRAKYQWQEGDALRPSITATELHGLTFDFRFWLSQFWGQGNLLASGLKWTASQQFQFAARRNFQADPEFSWPGAQRGRLQGHPSGRDDLEWFLDPDGHGMQWGKLPSLWPRGTIHRLPTWGWEIRNPNVCLRAMDSRPKKKFRNNNKRKTTSAHPVVGNNRNHNRNENANDDHNDDDDDDDDDDSFITSMTTTTILDLELVKDDEANLWGDYLKKLRRYPTDFGMPQEGIAFMEAPEEFWEFDQNRQRFPRLGIDEIILPSGGGAEDDDY